jgi:hypothetical protein
VQHYNTENSTRNGRDASERLRLIPEEPDEAA